eukprot:1157520-Pelagomonas_calceolata.AAC.6
MEGVLELWGCMKSLHFSTHTPHHTHPLSQGTACYARDDLPLQLGQELMGFKSPLTCFCFPSSLSAISASHSVYSQELDESQNLCTRQSARPEIAFAVFALVIMNLCITLYNVIVI